MSVGALGRTMQESVVIWSFGHLERRDENDMSRKIETLDVRGRPNLR